MKEVKLEEAAYQFEAKMSLRQAIPLGLQHVCAMFVGNLTPLLIITSACGIAGGEFADLQVTLLQSAMFVAGVVTLVQLFTIGPVGGSVPIIMGTSSGFIGVFNSVVGSMGGGVLAYGAIMGASIIGGIFESVLGFFLKPLRKFFPPVVTGTVVLSIGLSLISVGCQLLRRRQRSQGLRFRGNLLLAVFVLVVIPVLQALDHGLPEFFLHPHRHCGGISGSLHHGLCPAHHRCHCRGCGVHQGMGAELEQGGTGRLVCHPQAGSRQDHF